MECPATGLILSRSGSEDLRSRPSSLLLAAVAGFLLLALDLAHAQITIEQIVGTWTGTVEYASTRMGPGGSTTGTLIIKPDGTWTAQVAVAGSPPSNGTYELKGNIARSVILSSVPPGWGNTSTWTFTEKGSVWTMVSERDDKNTKGTYVKK